MKLLKKLILSSLLLAESVLANIPEPDIVFYGLVSSNIGNIRFPLYEGEIKWEIKPLDKNVKESYIFKTNMEALESGKYSYKLKIPQSLVVDIDTLMEKKDGSIDIDGAKELFFKHNSIEINGEKALLKDDTLSFFTASQSNRSSYKRLDLYTSTDIIFEQKDENNNYIPDSIENLFGITNIYADIDNDGLSNIEEAFAGTNPFVNNKIPLVESDVNLADDDKENIRLTFFENGWTQLRLNVVDIDTPHGDIDVIFEEIPNALELYNISDMNSSLNNGDSLTAEDLNDGKVVIRHNPEKLLDSNGIAIPLSNLKLVLHDNGALYNETPESNGSNAPIVAVIELESIKIDSMYSPVHWIDGMAYKDSNASTINGRSGYGVDKISSYSYNPQSATFKETGNDIMVNKNGMISIPQNDDFDQILAFPESSDEKFALDGDSSLYFVVNPTLGINTLFNNRNINLSLDKGTIYYNKTVTDKYISSALKAENGLIVASIHNESNRVNLFSNAKPVGGPKSKVTREIQPASALSSFGMAVGKYGEFDGYVEPFLEDFGEFIAFPHALTGRDRWMVNSYLLSKWKNYIVDNASRAVGNIKIITPLVSNENRILLGGIGDDTISGGLGDDILRGGFGKDTLRGEAGNDRFIVGDGDIIEDFTFNYTNLNSKDILDISELIVDGGEPLNSCLFFKPINDITLVKINKDCNASDQTKGTDYNDANFTIKGQALWNSDQIVLWTSGTIYAGSHKPESVNAKVLVENNSSIDVIENKYMDRNQSFDVTISYDSEDPYQGSDFWLPLYIKSDAKLGEDFTISMSRYIMNNDEKTIRELTNGKYSTQEELLNVDKSELLSRYNLEIDPYNYDYIFYEDINKRIMQHNYNPIEDQNINAEEINEGVVFYVPSPLHHNDKKIHLKVNILKDHEKESGEKIELELLQTPEFYETVSNSSKVEINIIDGKDRLYVEKEKSEVYEGSIGYFEIVRDGSINKRLDFYVALEGSSENGIDYDFVSKKVTFEEGVSTQRVEIDTLVDNIYENSEYVKLDLIASEDYDIDVNRASGLLYIYDYTVDNGDGTETISIKTEFDNSEVVTEIKMPKGLLSEIEGEDSLKSFSFKNSKKSLSINSKGGITISSGEKDFKPLINIENGGSTLLLSESGEINITTPSSINSEDSSCRYLLQVSDDLTSVITKQLLNEGSSNEIESSTTVNKSGFTSRVTSDGTLYHQGVVVNKQNEQLTFKKLLRCDGTTSLLLEDQNVSDSTYFGSDRAGWSIAIDSDSKISISNSYLLSDNLINVALVLDSDTKKLSGSLMKFNQSANSKVSSEAIDLEVGEKITISDDKVNYLTNSLTLNKGWSLASANIDIYSLLNEDIYFIWKYVDSSWQMYKNDRNSVKLTGYNTIESISNDEGIWIFSKTGDKLVTLDNSPSTTLDGVDTNWNLLGTSEDKGVSEIICSQNGNKSIWKYSDNQWKLFTSIKKDHKFETFDKVYANEGFWVKCY